MTINQLKQLMAQLGYQFQCIELLQEALTHRSIGLLNNERLEFLGDALLNTIMATELYHRFPKASEGQLSCLRASLVKGEQLAKIARQLQLGDYLHLGEGEMKSGGQHRISILADSLEAVIAAIFLDSTRIECCANVVMRWFTVPLESIQDEEQPLKDPKTRLQEYAHKKRIALPNYHTVKVTGNDHAQLFHVECALVDLQLSSQGQGSSRRRAEQQAASQLLVKLADS